MQHFLSDDLGKISIEANAVPDPKAVLILAHGAGAGMQHPFITSLSQSLADERMLVYRFNFPYMEAGRRSPGSPKKNITAWQGVVQFVSDQHQDLPLFLGGKSYGGRMASHLLAETELPSVSGLIYFGFPLHAPGKPSSERANHLSQITQPQLFLQGVKDKLADINLIRQVTQKLTTSSLVEFEEADHSFHVPKRSGIDPEELHRRLVKSTSEFIDNHR